MKSDDGFRKQPEDIVIKSLVHEAIYSRVYISLMQNNIMIIHQAKKKAPQRLFPPREIQSSEFYFTLTFSLATNDRNAFIMSFLFFAGNLKRRMQ